MTSLQIADRVCKTEENVWIEFTTLAAKCQPVNLGQGCADFAVAPTHVLEALAKIATQEDQPLLNQYTRTFGHPRLVRSLSKLYSNLVNRDIDSYNEMLVTYGASEALFCAVMAFVNPGDEVIIIEPFFDSYRPFVELAGGIPVFIPLRPQEKKGDKMTSADWKLNEDELVSCFSARTKMIIVNTPNNPVGKVFSRSELEFIGNLASEHNALILMDEVYEMITYSGYPHIRMASLPGMWDRTISVSSAGKVFSITGWKLGWAYGPKELLQPIQLMHNVMVSSCPTPLQEAVAICLETEVQHLRQPDSYWSGLSIMLEEKRDRLAHFLASVAMEPVIPQGSFFVVADFSKLHSMICIDEHGTKDHQFAIWLCKEKGLQGIPLSPFYSEEHQHLAKNYIRFCFMKDDSTLKKAEIILSSLKISLMESQET